MVLSRRKSNAHDIFICFKALVENYFSLKIITLYTDNGGEYQALASFLSINSISHLTTPHIHQNIMVIQKDYTATLLKLVSLFFLMHLFFSHIGLMLSPLSSILSIACLPPHLTSFSPSRKYLVIHLNFLLLSPCKNIKKKYHTS